jgi:uncharacterized protein YecE (DUF72 family)
MKRFEADRNLLIGTSGWSYDHWHGPFYPEHVPREHWLEYYARYFRSVEINNSFYRLPSESTLRSWYDAVPADFVFTVKASRFITHMKKLKDAEQSVPAFLQRISALGDKLGPVLMQLPPHWHFNAQRLRSFLDSLSDDFSYTFEFRDPSWLNEQCYALLSEHNAAFCIYELDDFQSPKAITADFVYVRLHGPERAYQGSYETRTLKSWAQEFSRWHRQGLSVYCYFDNDQFGYAAQNALELKSIIEK